MHCAQLEWLLDDPAGCFEDWRRDIELVECRAAVDKVANPGCSVADLDVVERSSRNRIIIGIGSFRQSTWRDGALHHNEPVMLQRQHLCARKMFLSRQSREPGVHEEFLLRSRAIPYAVH